MTYLSLRSTLRTIVLGVLLYLAACDQWRLTVNSDGLVFISVIEDDAGPRDRFRVRIRDAEGTVRVLDIPPSRELTLSPTASGTLELTLLAPQRCTVAGPNPRVLTVAQDEIVRVSFDVRCTG